MMPDERDAENAKSELDLALLVARIGAIYTRQQLSPPFNLRSAVMAWRGLTVDEAIAVLDRHFADHRHKYSCGAGEQWFGMVVDAMRQALDRKHPRPPLKREPERLQRPRRQVVMLPTAGAGPPDVLVDDPRAERPVSDRDKAPVERTSSMGGYERSGVPISIEDDAGEET